MMKIKEKIQWLLKEGSFRRNVATMFSGTVVSQVVYLLFYPVLTRLYTPSHFGQYAIFLTFLSILSLLATGQYEQGILLPKKEKNVKVLSLGAIFIAAVMSILLTAVLLLSRPVLQKYNLFNNSDIISFLGISVFINALYQIGIYLSLRKKDFKSISAINILNVAFSILFQAILSQTSLKEFGLSMGYMVGTLVSMGFLLYQNKRTFVIKNAFIELVGDARNQLVRFKKFPLFNLPATLVNLLANQAPQILLNTFGQSVVGYFSLSQRILGSPVTLFSTSLSHVFKEKASSDYRNKGNCEAIFVKTFKTLFMISIIPFLLVFIFSPFLVPIVFGSQWEMASPYIQALTLMFFFKFTVSPLSYVIIIAEKQKLNLVLQSLLLILIIISISIGLYRKDPLLAVILYSIVYSFIYALFLLISYKLSKNGKKDSSATR
ncbi:MAG: O-antigen translocase [candidate division WS6 bacterium GW2011_GWF2_39_15]|uniref:O-antigen translocase n=1 Tax=candidate division WS6 bacterium GW2011_GWF2_39_15 TaxID=1619100 RepID=A0A0G0MRG9_9BACT|nr:MAG: O-antigen translocase [candidate division WS6 bacterium GW2011_GWF2_39_15]